MSVDRWSVAALLGLSADALTSRQPAAGRLFNPDSVNVDQRGQLITVAEVEQLLGSHALVSPLVRVVHNGKRLPVEAFTVASGSEPDAVRYVDSLKLFRCFRDGGSVVIRDLHRYWPALRELSWDLSRELGFAVTVNGYLSPPNAQAFKPHFDYHDIIVIQLNGSKEWVEFDTNAELPLDNNNWRRPTESVNPTLPGDNPAEVGSHTLKAGDVLFVPRGGSHAVRSGDEVSLHLTLELQRWTAYDLAATLLDHVAESPQLRSALPLHVGSDEVPADWLTSVAGQFSEFAARADRADLSWALYRDSHCDLLETPIPLVRQYETLQSLDHAQLERRRDLIFTVQDEPGAVVVRTRDRTIRFPPSTAPLIRAAMSGAPVSLDLGVQLGLSQEHARQSLRSLLSEGLLIESPAQTDPARDGEPAREVPRW